jgi:FlaA1/EpsC-like NDP-sugar epimerase
MSLRTIIEAFTLFATDRSRGAKRSVVLTADALVCAAASLIAIYLRMGLHPAPGAPYGLLIAGSVAMALPIFWMLGLYREIYSQFGVRGIIGVGRACALYAIPFALVFTLLRVAGVPRTLSLIQPILLFTGVCSSRLLVRSWLLEFSESHGVPPRRVLIYGAGSAGRQLAAAVAQSREMLVVGFLDDNRALIGQNLDGRPILNPANMASAVRKLSADEILLALPSASRGRRKEIIAQARRANVCVRTLPGLMDIAHGRVEASHIQELEIADLLGRGSVEPDLELMRAGIAGKIVMVTGAGGSIGSELCRQLLGLDPAILLLVEISEFGLYEIHRELAGRALDHGLEVQIVPLLGSVCDHARMEEIVGGWRPDTIYHVAAYKHVPLVEQNPAEGVRTNVFGTYTLASVAAEWRVGDFVLVSTDKAVRPTNVMGASKRAAELVLQALNQAWPLTRFSIVRFGNVLGSSGSVVPLFRQQIRSGGPVTVTDRRVTRYFMTVSEAAELVLQAAAMAEGGEVFVLDMGEPVLIAELARNMIELSGLRVKSPEHSKGDIEIVEIGLRPGEKLYEELLIGNSPSAAAHPRIWKADEPFLPLAELRGSLDRMARLLDGQRGAELIEALAELVPEFEHGGVMTDPALRAPPPAPASAPVAIKA